MKNFLLVFGIAFLLFSCEKESGIDLMNSENGNNQDLLLKSGKPAQPGDNGKVIRYDQGLAWYFFDEDENLTAYIGIDPRPYCSGQNWAFDILSIQDIVKDEGNDEPRIHTLIKQDDVRVLVLEGIASSSFCPDFLSEEPVFTGTGRLVLTDNDVIPFREKDNNNYNSFGIRVIGEGIRIIYQQIWDGENIPTAKAHISIMLK